MKLAAVSYESGQGEHVDALLSRLAVELASQGVRLAGCVRSMSLVPEGRVAFDDLASGRRLHALELVTSSAVDSGLDSSALEEAAGLAIASLGDDTGLVIVNRFGRQEADGHGFRPLIELAVVMNVPVLVGLNMTLMPEWAQFTRAEGALLAPRPGDIDAWCAGVGVNGAAGLRR